MLTAKYALGALPFVLLAGSLMAGCGPSDSDSGASGTGGSAATGGAGSGGAATGGTGTGGTGTGGAGTGGGASFTKGGSVAFLVLGSGLLTATFNDDPPTGNCVEVKSDGCSAWTCDDAPDQADPSDPDAGVVTFTSADVAGSATATPDASGRYTSTYDFADGFHGGEKGLFTATGGEIPAFEQALDLPLALLLDQPAYDQGAPQHIPRSSDLTLQWSRGAEDVALYVQASSERPDGLPGGASFSCVFPSASGSAVIPSTILSTVASGTIPTVLTTKRVTQTLGEYSVTAWTGYPMYNAAKDQPIQPTLD